MSPGHAVNDLALLRAQAFLSQPETDGFRLGEFLV
jgi:hypothetical protein